MIEYIGKCLLIDKKVLVAGDLHLGYIESLRKSGVFVFANLYTEIEKDFKQVFQRVGKVETIILLGDVKHAIGMILPEERKQFTQLFKYLSDKADTLVLLKGNHDVLLEPILRDFDVKLKDWYVYKDTIFMHGDRDFPELHDKGVKRWIIGHAHPAATLHDGAKSETYKCFLVGTYKGREVIVVPSFFPFVEGTDPRDSDMDFPWELSLGNFTVKIVGENLEILDFGMLKRLPHRT